MTFIHVTELERLRIGVVMWQGVNISMEMTLMIAADFGNK
jgi:hypothetical protein